MTLHFPEKLLLISITTFGALAVMLAAEAELAKQALEGCV